MLRISYQPPYDWMWMLGFLAARAVAGIEEVGHDFYRRSLALDGHQGLLTVTPDAQRHAVIITLSAGLQPVAEAVLTRITRLLDLSLAPQSMLDALGPLATARPGLRLPGCVDPFEQTVRTVLGQLVSVNMAARLTAKLVATLGEPCAGHSD